MAYTLRELAGRIDAELRGDPECLIESVATITSATSGQISFLSNSTYKKYLASTKASAIVLTAEDATDYQRNVLIMKKPYLGFSQIVGIFHPPLKKEAGIAASAVVADSATIHPSVHIADGVIISENVVIDANSVISAGTVVAEGVKIGANCLIHSNVNICHEVQLGNDVIVHPGVVIGSDGFGIANDGGVWKKIAQIGSVVIGDDVEIGANTTIDRGALEDTVIENGVKIDNQVQIAHNCHIGEHTAIAGCVGISGSTHIGKRCMIGGASALAGHIEICDDVILTGFSMVTKSVHKPGMYSSGVPLNDNLKWRKNIARFNKLDVFAQRLKVIEKKMEE